MTPETTGGGAALQIFEKETEKGRIRGGVGVLRNRYNLENTVKIKTDSGFKKQLGNTAYSRSRSI